MAVASITAPHSTRRCAMRLPSLDTNHFSVSQIWWLACASGTPASAITPVASTRRSARSVRLTSSSGRSEEHTSELQSLMRISYAVFCLKKKKQHINNTQAITQESNTLKRNNIVRKKTEHTEYYKETNNS